MSQASPLKLARKWVLLDLIGAVLSAIGTYYLLESPAQKAVGIALLAIGVPMMIVAILQILRGARVRPPRR